MKYTTTDLADALEHFIPDGDGNDAEVCEWRLHEVAHIMSLPSDVWRTELDDYVAQARPERNLNDVLDLHHRLSNRWEIRAAGVVHAMARMLLEGEDLKQVCETSLKNCPINLIYDHVKNARPTADVAKDVEEWSRRQVVIRDAKRAIRFMQL